MKFAFLMLSVLLASVPASAGNAAQDAAARALRMDFERDGVVASTSELRDLYQQACDLGYERACRWESWHGDLGLADLAKAREIFAGSCSRNDPAACMVEGWAIEAEPIPQDLTEEEKLNRKDVALARAYHKYKEGCYSGTYASCFELGRYSIARYRLLLPTRPAEAAKYLKPGETVLKGFCRSDYLPGCVLLGELQPQVPEDLDKRGSAGSLYTQSCDAGDPSGCYHLGMLLTAQRSTAENRHWFDDLCSRGHTNSCAWVARSLEGTDESLNAWKRACLLHDVEGCRRVGAAIEASQPAEAMQVHQMGCALDDGTSCGRLGLLMLTQGEDKSAATYLERGCDAGVVAACVEIGLMRLDGTNVDRDAVQAKNDLLRACPEEGERSPRACSGVGRIYEAGIGSEKDRAIAARYYRYACMGGDLDACFRTGEAVAALQRTSRTPLLQEWALLGYTKACDGGLHAACLPAAELLARGPEGVRDVQAAKDLYDASCYKAEDALTCRSYGNWLQGRPLGDSDLAEAREAFGRGMALDDSESMRQLAKMLYYGHGGKTRRGKARRLFRESCSMGNQAACGGVEQVEMVRPY